MFESYDKKEAEVKALANKVKDAEKRGDLAYEKLLYRDSISLLAEALIATKVARYVRLGRYLEKIEKIEILEKNAEVEKSQTVTEDGNIKEYFTEKEIKTTYKQLKKIEKKGRKLNAKWAKLVNKYDEVRRFYLDDSLDVELALKDFIRNKVFSPLEREFDYVMAISGSDSRILPSELTEFFNNRPELEFVDESKLTKGNSR